MVRPPNFRVAESENFRSIYASGIFGGLNPAEGRIIFYHDRLKIKPVENTPGGLQTKEIVHEMQVEVHMSPANFKVLAEWAMKHVQNVEKHLGHPIKTAPEDSKKKTPSPYA